jgi:hypothetical protein
MAKEQWHRWGQTVVTIITLAFVCGITYSRIEINTNDISEVETDIKNIGEEVHELEVNQQRDIALREALLQAAVRMEGKMDRMSIEQNIIKADVIATKVKVDTLIKD